MKKLASRDPEEQECGKMLADEILEENAQRQIDEDKVRVKADRSVINKYPNEDNTCNDPNKMSKGKWISYTLYNICICRVPYTVKI